MGIREYVCKECPPERCFRTKVHREILQHIADVHGIMGGITRKYGKVFTRVEG